MDKIILVIYALFLMLGGYFGFKKGSSVSLAMGLGSGIMVLIGIWLMGVNPKGAWIFINCINGMLVVAFLLRFMKTQAFMPSGMLLVISAAIAIYALLRLLKV